jgi:glutamate synthase (NADPH/NADH) small chain
VTSRDRAADGAADIRAGRLPPDAYAETFADLHPPLDRNEARVAAERCLFCFDAPCIHACPTAIDIPLFIRQITTGNPHGAAKTILDANIFGGMCARVCPTETLCEEACVRTAEGKPIEIGRLQRHATDALFASGRQLYRRGAATGARVAVVGAGPAGLACAHKLATLGHEAVVFDAREKPGGLNEHGIAAYKTVNDFAQREVEWILGVGGIELRHGVQLGRDLLLADLRRDFDAVFLGVGLQDVNALGVDTGGLAGVHDAVTFIEALRQADDLGSLPIGRRVVVVGGGMTAVDAAVQAKKLGAEEVTMVYRRGPEAMGASRYEQELAQTAGVVIRFWARPLSVEGEAGQLRAVTFAVTADEAAGSSTRAKASRFPPTSSSRPSGRFWSRAISRRRRAGAVLRAHRDRRGATHLAPGRLGRRRLRPRRARPHGGGGGGRQAGGALHRPGAAGGDAAGGGIGSERTPWPISASISAASGPRTRSGSPPRPRRTRSTTSSAPFAPAGAASSGRP